jgi:hypothetical protein
MKIAAILALVALTGSCAAFSVTTPSSPRKATQHHMFGGAGAGVPNEDNPEELKQMEAAAKQMGMSLGEYKLGVSARMRLVQQLDAARVKGGSDATVSVERDGNNPPKYMVISITDAGKALGKDALSAELIKALKTASDASRVSRTNAQKEMMTYIGEEMKKV